MDTSINETSRADLERVLDIIQQRRYELSSIRTSYKESRAEYKEIPSHLHELTFATLEVSLRLVVYLI